MIGVISPGMINSNYENDANDVNMLITLIWVCVLTKYPAWIFVIPRCDKSLCSNM